MHKVPAATRVTYNLRAAAVAFLHSQCYIGFGSLHNPCFAARASFRSRSTVSRHPYC
jgi:hypothetical protein